MDSAGRGYNLTGQGEAERVPGLRVTASFFDVLGIPPMLGRTFLKEEEDAGRDRVVVLSHGLWTRRYGADRRDRRQDHPDRRQGARRRRRDAGVVRLRVRQPPRAVGAGRLDGRRSATARSNSFVALGRLKPGVTIEQARSEMDTIGRALSARVSGREREPDRARRADERIRHAAEALAAVADAGGGRVRAADRVRQRRQPDAGARGLAIARAGHPRHARRGPRAHRPAAADRERRARLRRRHRRPADRLLGHAARILPLLPASIAASDFRPVDARRHRRSACSPSPR